MKKDTHGFPRRAFLGGSLVGGLGLALGLDHPAEAAAPDEACLPFAASDMLALFSLLAWKLPVKLQRAEDAKKVEGELYKTFDQRYQKLSELAKKLNRTCANLTQNDPRRQAAEELAEVTEKNVRGPRPGTMDSDAVYLRIAVLVAENRYLSANANAVLPQTAPDQDDNRLICEMLAEIRAMDKIKVDLDVARKDFAEAFTDFTSNLKALHTNIVNASEDSAKAERGEGSKDAAIERINAAQKILDEMSRQSTPGGGSMVTPEGLKILLEVPKAALENRITPTTVTQLTDGEIQFRKASFDPQASRFAQISAIIRENIFPSSRSTVYWLAFSCSWILDFYSNDPPREGAIRNTLQSWPLASSESRFQTAAARIARLR
jgi:hypothetical protein